MNLSQIPDYLEFMRNFSLGRFRESVGIIIRIIEDYDISDDQRAFLLAKMGDAEWDMGNHSRALDAYKEARITSAPFTIINYLYCKFLLEKVKNMRAGLNACEEAIEGLSRDPFDASEEDFSSVEYIEMYRDLINKYH